IIQPSISPFSAKNRNYEGPADQKLENSVSFNGRKSGPTPSLQQILGWRYFLHVSRWDSLKGIDRIITAFIRFVRAASDEENTIRLVIAGPDPLDVADDPEGRTYFEKCLALRDQLPTEVQQ
ncbi:glycosyl transferase group 1, partial [Paraburkholderia sp. EG304]